MGFFEELRTFSEIARQRRPTLVSRGEAATQHALIAPFLAKLGFDIADPSEVQPEYDADFDRRRPKGQPERVDYAIFFQGKPAIFVECKAVNVALDNHDGQLSRYFNSTRDVRLAILTNGLKYRFFTDLCDKNRMDPEPFLEFDILNLQERDVGMIEKFTKSQFNPSNVTKLAQEFIFIRNAAPLVSDLLNNPQAKFIPFILKELARPELLDGHDAANQYEPIVKQLIHNTLLAIMNKAPLVTQQESGPTEPARVASLESPAVKPGQPHPVMAKAAPTPTAEPPQVLVAQVTPAAVEAPHPHEASNPDKDGAVDGTAKEKSEIFQLVKDICKKSLLKSTVGNNDGAVYFSINLGTPHSWFLRLFAGIRRKSFITRLPVTHAQSLLGRADGCSVEKAPEIWGVSRVYFGSPTDMEKLRPLILAAYEAAVKLKEASGSKADETGE